MSVAGLCIDLLARQRVLDASLELLWCRRDALRALTGQPSGPNAAVGAKVVASGDLTAWTMEQAARWRHLLSTRAAVSGTSLARSMPNNRRICAGDNGLRMVSIFDYESTEPEARSLLEHEPSTAYYYAFVPLQIKIVDRRQVLMQGPADHCEQSLISLTSGRALSAAGTYWSAVRETAVPCRRPAAVPALSDRQVEIFDLMLTGLTDEVIARTLGVSVRTVRGDVSDAEAAMGVCSRFAAGFAFAAGHAG